MAIKYSKIQMKDCFVDSRLVIALLCEMRIFCCDRVGVKVILVNSENPINCLHLRVIRRPDLPKMAFSPKK